MDHQASEATGTEVRPDMEAEDAFQPDRDLLGEVFMIPNKHWDFENVSSSDHPGACFNYRSAKREGGLVKGTDSAKVRYSWRYIHVEATDQNGLDKRTAFETVPRYFRFHRLRLYYPERRLGNLGNETLQRLRDELARLHPED
ncbi:MAG: hypothetical protein ACFCD0_27320 [Gemmataceae bacterium]